MKYLITGANGQLGRELTRILGGCDCLAVGRDELDITDCSQVETVVAGFRPDVVIHAAAFTNVDGAESDATDAYRVNAAGAQNVALACAMAEAAMVYISTDYVFDGELGRPYTEFDPVRPLNVYGKSKYAGEVLTRHCLNRLYIVRTSWVFGEGQNFVRTMLKLAQEQNELKVVDDQYGRPTYARDLAQAILQLTETGKYGIYHVANAGVTTWYHFAREIFGQSGIFTVKVTSTTTEELARPAPRPRYSALGGMMLELATGHSMRCWQEALREYLKKL